MTSHDAERAYVAAMLEHQQEKFDQTSAAMQADLDRLRGSWSSGFAEQLQAHEQRMAHMRDAQAAWFKSLHDDEPAPTQDVAQQISQDASGSGGDLPPRGRDLLGNHTTPMRPSWPRPRGYGTSACRSGPRSGSGLSGPTGACSARRDHE